MNENKKYYIYKMDLKTLNIISILMLITMILLTLIIENFTKTKITLDYINTNMGIICIAYILYMILHEIFHSISYIIHGAKRNKITFGAHIEKGILCCLCKQNITRKNILASSLYPFFYLGIITYIIGFIINSPLLIILSVLNISGCAGDLLMFSYFIKLKNIEFSEFDDPISFALYSSKDLSKNTPLGIKFIETTNNIKREELKKITISRASYISFTILLIISIILIYL